MDIDSKNLDLAVAKIKEEISRWKQGLSSLEQGLSSLEEAREFLRVHPNLMSSSNGAKKRRRTERHAHQPGPQLERGGPTVGNDLAGKTMLEAADVLFSENGNEQLSPEDIVEDALSRGYRSTHPKNRENDPAKLARSIRLMMDRHPEKYERNEGKYCLK